VRSKSNTQGAGLVCLSRWCLFFFKFWPPPFFWLGSLSPFYSLIDLFWTYFAFLLFYLFIFFIFFLSQLFVQLSLSYTLSFCLSFSLSLSLSTYLSLNLTQFLIIIYKHRSLSLYFVSINFTGFVSIQNQ